MRQKPEIALCTTLDQLRDLRPYWDRLGTCFDAPFGKWRWVMSSAETVTEDARLFVPLVVEQGAPVAVAPLSRSRSRFAALRQIGAAAGEPADFSYKDVASLRLLVGALAVNRVPLFLRKVPAESPLVTAVQVAYRHRAFVLLRPRADCPFIDIEATEELTAGKLSASLRSDLRRAWRRAERIGVVSVETHAPASERDLLPLWADALRVEAAGWKGRRGSALQMNPRVGSFYRAYAVRACEQGILRVLLLKVGSQTAASMIALEVGERLWVLKIGYDERFAKCSPGMLVMEAGLRYAARQGLRSFEFLGAEADWTHRWTDCGRPNLSVFVYPYTPQGATVFACDVARLARRKARERLGGGTP